jgi:hypothetical protein
MLRTRNKPLLPLCAVVFSLLICSTPAFSAHYTTTLTLCPPNDVIFDGTCAVDDGAATAPYVERVVFNWSTDKETGSTATTQSHVYTFTDFPGPPESIITTLGADPSGATNQVAITQKNPGAVLWTGTVVGDDDIVYPLNATDSQITVRVYSPDVGIPVRLKVEDATDLARSVETEAITTVANAWETLTFDFNNEVIGTPALNPTFTYDRLVIFFNFGTDGDTAGSKTYYWDDATFNGPTSSVVNFEDKAGEPGDLSSFSVEFFAPDSLLAIGACLPSATNADACRSVFFDNILAAGNVLPFAGEIRRYNDPVWDFELGANPSLSQFRHAYFGTVPTSGEVYRAFDWATLSIDNIVMLEKFVDGVQTSYTSRQLDTQTTIKSPAPAAQAFDIDGLTYVRSETTETLIVPFSQSRITPLLLSVATQNTYSGLVEIFVSGTGRTGLDDVNDAIWTYANNNGDVPNFEDYQLLALDIKPLEFSLFGLREMQPQFNTVFDAREGLAKDPLAGIPLIYQPDHNYSFVVDLAQTLTAIAGTPLPATLNLGNATLHSVGTGGAYTISVYQLEETLPPLSVINPVADITYDEDVSYQYVAFDTVFSSMDGVTVTFENTAPLVVGAYIGDGGEGLIIQNSANQHGSADIILRATDGITTVDAPSFSVTVTPVNDAPSINFSPADLGIPAAMQADESYLISSYDLTENVGASVDQRLFFDVDQIAINSDGDDQMTVTGLSSDSAIVSVTRVDGGLLLSASAPGTAEITLTATDTYGLSAEQRFSVEVFGTVALLQVIKDPINGTFFAALITGNAGETLQTLEVLTSDSCVNGQLANPTVVNTYTIGTAASDEQEAIAGFDAQGKALVVGLIGSGESDSNVPVSTYLSARINGVAAVSGATTCMVTGSDNDSWVRASLLDVSTGEASAGGYIDRKGNARWFKFPMPPGAKAQVNISNLPKDYDLYVFKDINKAFETLVGEKDVEGLVTLSAEFAPSVFSPSVFSPSVFSPSVFSPDAYAPSVFSPSVFSPSVFSPSVFSPSVFSPSVFSPSVFSPSVFSPSVFSPSVFSPSVFSPSVFSPSVFSSDNFASAQMRSIIGLAAQEGTTSERVSASSWNSPGEYYVRVSGKNGVFDIETPFELTVSLDDVSCNNVSPNPNSSTSNTPVSISNSYETVILWDRDKMEADNSSAELNSLEMLLRDELSTKVGGVLVDLAQDTHIQALHRQADDNPSCPYAENLVAAAIKDVVSAYRAGNSDRTNAGGIKYVVLIGNDSHIPFFRYPDTVGLGPEQNYDPSLADDTQSQAALRLNYLLGQDEYGAARTLELIDGKFPLPDLAVGRLVESAAEIMTVVDAYLNDTDERGTIDDPTSTLVTGYDFLTDVADAVDAELRAGTLNARHDTLIADAQLSPDDPLSWTATDLQRELLEDGEDIIFLAGHFSAVSALASDYKTQALSTDLLSTGADYTNSIVFSAGCHSGYNIVDGDVVPGTEVPSDWAQVFASKGATLIAGTGYQYGDTDFIYYSERLYLQFARELRYGAIGDPVSVGEALVRAKQYYLSTTPEMTGLHRKSMLISTLFGLPMLSLDLKGERTGYPNASQTDACPDDGLQDATGVPGSTLGLQTCALNVTASLEPVDVVMTGLSGAQTLSADPVDTSFPCANGLGTCLEATYLEGPDGVVVNPGQPTLPLVVKNVTASGLALRGVGLRGGTWTERTILPLTGAATTELRGVHTSFASPVNFPMRLTNTNYFDALMGGDETTLFVTPAQHRADPNDPEFIRSILRQFSNMDFALYYSDNTQIYAVDGDPDRSNRPALAGPPTMSGVQALLDGNDIIMRANVVGDPSAGIESVWVTYTDGSQSAGTWVSIDLVQDQDDSTLWSAALPNPGFGRLDYMLQAVNGVGLVTMDDNSGAYYQLAGDLQDLDADGELPPAPFNYTDIYFISGSSSGTYGETAVFAASLGTDQLAIEGAKVTFAMGSTSRSARTDEYGTATVSLPLNATPGDYPLRVSFAGNELDGPTNAEQTFTVLKSDTQLTFHAGEQRVGVEGIESGLIVALTDDDAIEYDNDGIPGGTLRERTVYFTITGGPADTSVTVPVITDNVGRANLRELALPAGSYSVTARFMGTIPTGFDVDGTALFRTLTDELYQSSSADFILELEGNADCPSPGQESSHHSKKSNKHHSKKSNKHHSKKSNKHKLELRGFCYLTSDIDGDIKIQDGTLIVGRGVEVKKKIDQKGAGSVYVLESAVVRKDINEKGAGNIIVDGTVGGKLKEKGLGGIIIGATALIERNVDEHDAGSIIVNGEVKGNVKEKSDGDLIVNATGTIAGHAEESGKGSLLNSGSVN